ncbi:MAG: hypothetical protein Q8L21_00010 [Candidatus Komeilibacteria bacterium]|nr:hypothetical protein [Candidatus Komeilibacteria bacterium]
MSRSKPSRVLQKNRDHGHHIPGVPRQKKGRKKPAVRGLSPMDTQVAKLAEHLVSTEPGQPKALKPKVPVPKCHIQTGSTSYGPYSYIDCPGCERRVTIHANGPGNCRFCGAKFEAV